MKQILDKGLKVQLERTNTQGTIRQLIGRGGQGNVYLIDVDGRQMALKWYHLQYLPADPGLRKRLESIIHLPPPTSKFLWPLEIATIAGEASFGYIMPLKEARFRSVEEVVYMQIDPGFREITTAGIHLADSYLQLHSRGRCYRDISFGNCSLDPDTGDIVILDNDNVDVNGQPTGILGTPRFIAPELVRQRTAKLAARAGRPVDTNILQKDVRTSTQTDLYSLSVLLFFMFMRHHPLFGKKEAAIAVMDEEEQSDLLGQKPLFIFDPEDTSNAPNPVTQPNPVRFWKIYPQFLRDRFLQAFTRGLHDPERGRVRETEWRETLLQLRDCLVYCPACGSENFSDMSTQSSHPLHCWNPTCSQAVDLPARVHIGRIVTMLNRDTKLYPYHIHGDHPFDLSPPVAEVAQHPTQPSLWGLKNLTAEKWTYTPLGGTVTDAPPNRSIKIAAGTIIHFGHTKGEIRL